jgi:anti-sigma B factor antagonist
MLWRMDASRATARLMAGQRDGDGPYGEAFEVVDLALGAVAGVAVRGEVELATAARLTAALDDAIRRSDGPFAIDLSSVGFLDSSGISCLVRARALLGRDDRTLALVCPPGGVRRVLEIAGIDELVALYASREELARGVE